MDSPPVRLCGACTRSGGACKAWAMRNGRCKLHGGKSLFGIAHPNYKHGLYSKYCPSGAMRRAVIRTEKRRERTERKINRILAQEKLERERQQRIELAKSPPWNVENLMALLPQVPKK